MFPITALKSLFNIQEILGLDITFLIVMPLSII